MQRRFSGRRHRIAQSAPHVSARRLVLAGCALLDRSGLSVVEEAWRWKAVGKLCVDAIEVVCGISRWQPAEGIKPERPVSIGLGL
jgi:hypothetical protein